MPTLETWVALVAAIALTSGCVACLRHIRYTARVQLAAETARLAARWEREGQIQKAYRAYSEVYDGAFRIDSADMPPNVSDRVLPLYRSIVTAHDDALRALDAYRDKVGRYPERLEGSASGDTGRVVGRLPRLRVRAQRRLGPPDRHRSVRRRDVRPAATIGCEHSSLRPSCPWSSRCSLR